MSNHSGGSHREPNAGYTESACLFDGKYNFTIFNSQENGNLTSSESPGSYTLKVNGSIVIRSGLDSGYNESTLFVLGPNTMSARTSQSIETQKKIRNHSS